MDCELTDVGRRAAAIILFAVWPVAQVFVPRATPFFLALAVVALLVAGIAGQSRDLRPRIAASFRSNKLISIVFFLFLTVMIVSLLWSPLPSRAAKDVAVLLSAFLATGYLTQHLSWLKSPRLAAFVFGALVVGSVGLLLESWGITSLHDTFLRTNGIFDLNRNAAWLLVLGCAAFCFLGAGGMSVSAALLTAALIVIAIFSAQGEAVKLAVLATAVAAVATRFYPALTKPLFAVMAAIVLTMPLLANTLADDAGNPSIPLPPEAHADHRIALWQGYAKLAVQKPILGWGAKADRMLGETGQATVLAAERGYPDKITSPHNAALEIWVCMGVIGAALAAAMLLVAGWGVASMPTYTRVSGVAMMVAIFTISMTGSAFYQSWWIATIAMGFMVWGCAAKREGQGKAR